MQFLASAIGRSQKKGPQGVWEKTRLRIFRVYIRNLNIWVEESRFLFRKLFRPHASCICELAGRERQKANIYP